MTYRSVLCLLLSAAIIQSVPSVGYAQAEACEVTRPFYPYFSWTTDFFPTICSTDEEIRAELRAPSQFSTWTATIRIPSAALPRYHATFRETGILSLQVDDATNDDLRMLSQLDRLVRLQLRRCKADDFRPLTKLARLAYLQLENINLNQFKEEQLVAQMPSLRNLELYNVADLQETLRLPGLKPAEQSKESEGDFVNGIYLLRVHSPKWSPSDKTDWPESLDTLPSLWIYGERVHFGYDLQHRSAQIDIGRYESDAPETHSTLLKDLVQTSGFFERRRVVSAYLTCKRNSPSNRHRFEHDPTDISPLKAFTELKYLSLEGNFYSLENLKDVPLEWVHFREMSPFPSEQAVKVLSQHPTVQTVKKTIYSATEEVLFQRQ